MKNIPTIGFSVAIALLPPAPVLAQEFSAEIISRAADGKVSKSKLYQTPEKERLDSTVQLTPGKTVDTHMIIDRREKMIYLVEPQQKMVLINHVLQSASNTSGSASSTANPCEELMRMINPIVVKQQFGCKQVGRESVNGRGAEKWQMDSKGLGSGSAYLWVDLRIKTAIRWTLPDGSSGELQNIKLEPQPASLFELPANYRKQDLPQ